MACEDIVSLLKAIDQLTKAVSAKQKPSQRNRAWHIFNN